MNSVGIAELKARLSAHLRRVRRGVSLVVVDRQTPIARIVPYGKTEPLAMRPATKRPRELRLPPAPPSATDSLATLLADRAKR